MKNLSIENILQVTNGKLIIGDKSYICENFCRDTRKINKGDTYIGIKGVTFDGSIFWKEALKNGAGTVIVENIDFEVEDLSTFSGKNIIKVENTLEALYSIARFKRNLYDIPVVAITGSVGKTSTKDIIASVLATKYKTLKTEGNNNNNIGLPFTILKLKDEEAMVLEMGMNHFGEISLLTSISKPTVCVITNIGTSHIGNLGSRENILKAKLEILEGNKDADIIINNDNDLLGKWSEENKQNKKICTYGIENKSNFMAKNIELGIEGSSFETVIYNKLEKIQVPVGGNHFILNALSAIAVGKNLKINAKDIVQGIANFELTKKRMDIIELDCGIKIINDAYNASFESMKATLNYLKEFKLNRKIAVLGDMFELGEFSEKLHRDVGNQVIEAGIDVLICSGKNSRHIVDEVKDKGKDSKDIFYFENKEDIVEKLIEISEPGDIILFKASNGMKFFELAEKVMAFFSKKC